MLRTAPRTRRVRLLPGRRTAPGWLVAASAAVVLAPLLGGAAAASPPQPVNPAAIEPLAPYDPQTTCSPTVKPGTAALRSLVHAAYPITGDLGIVRECAIGGTSEHKEGRAWDWAVDAYNPQQDAAAKDMFAWLFATDSQGHPYAMARRLGIMYMIYNQHIWGAYDPGAGWRPYTGDNPHVDHVHISLSWPGALQTASYWVAGSTPAPSGAFLTQWSSLGGAGGPLGQPRGAQYAVPGGQAQDFQWGRIYSSPATGTHALYGAIFSRFVAAGGQGLLGLPTGEEGDVPGGRATRFSSGQILWSVATGAHVVQGLISDRYDAVGGPGGYLALPTTDEVAVTGGRGSSFQGGGIYWSGPTGAHAVRGLVAAHYDALGGPAGALGLPTSDEVDVPGGRASSFTGGGVYWSPGTGAWSVQGLIYGHYGELGGPGGYLGLPIADEAATAGTGRVSGFQGGRVYWSGPSGAAAVHGAIGQRYDALGGPGSALGMPVADEQDAAGLGRVSGFQGGSIYWSLPAGAAMVAGPALANYLSSGGAGGFLGMPQGELADAAPGVRQQVFAGGRVYVEGDAAHSVGGAILAAYLQLSGPAGALGAPTSDEYAVAGGRRSDFRAGSLTWDAATGRVTRS